MRYSIFVVLILASLAFPATAENLGRYYIRNEHTGQYLTAEGKADSLEWTHEPVIMRPLLPVGKRESQTWTFERPANMTEQGYWIWNKVSGRVLDANDKGLAASHPARASKPGGTQRWLMEAGRLQLADLSLATRCLDAYYNGRNYGPTVGLWSCHRGDHSNQKWVLLRADD